MFRPQDSWGKRNSLSLLSDTPGQPTLFGKGSGAMVEARQIYFSLADLNSDSKRRVTSLPVGPSGG